MSTEPVQSVPSGLTGSSGTTETRGIPGPSDPSGPSGHKSKKDRASRVPRQPSPPLTDEEARDIIGAISDLAGAQCLIATDRLMIGKLTDRLRRATLVFQAIVAIIGGLSGLCGVVLTPTDAALPKSAKIALYILAGLASSGVALIPKAVDWIKRFSGRSFKEEFPKWEKCGYAIDSVSSGKDLGDAQIAVLSMFAFVRPENDLRMNEPGRHQIHALTHFLTIMQSTSSGEQFREAFRIVMPVFRIASTSQFVSGKDV